MDQLINKIYQLLQKLGELNRQLLEVVELEREALARADLKAIEDVTSSKQKLMSEIHQAESTRLKLKAELVLLRKKSSRELTPPHLIIEIQYLEPQNTQSSKTADQFRSIFNTHSTSQPGQKARYHAYAF